MPIRWPDHLKNCSKSYWAIKTEEKKKAEEERKKAAEEKLRERQKLPISQLTREEKKCIFWLARSRGNNRKSKKSNENRSESTRNRKVQKKPRDTIST